MKNVVLHFMNDYIFKIISSFLSFFYDGNKQFPGLSAQTNTRQH